MAAPKYIIEKAKALQKALNRVDALSSDIEEWVSARTEDEYEGTEFFFEYHLDSPYEFNLGGVLEALEEISARCC